MPNLTDESTAIALALVNDAHRLLRLVANRDLQTTHGTFVQMGRTMGFADRRLAGVAPRAAPRPREGAAPRAVHLPAHAPEPVPATTRVR